jgi:archaellum component FlaC
MMNQEEKGKKVRELLEGQKKNIQEMRMSITGFDTKIDRVDKVVEMLMEEQGRVKYLVDI